MYFGMKSYLKSNHYHTAKHPLNLLDGDYESILVFLKL